MAGDLHQGLLELLDPSGSRTRFGLSVVQTSLVIQRMKAKIFSYIASSHLIASATAADLLRSFVYTAGVLALRLFGSKQKKISAAVAGQQPRRPIT